MPKRPNLRDHAIHGELGPRGREAIFGPSPQQPPLPIAQAEPAPTWEATHQRVTFYCSVRLLGQIEAEMRRSRRSKTAVIADAIREHLKVRS